MVIYYGTKRKLILEKEYRYGNHLLPTLMLLLYAGLGLHLGRLKTFVDNTTWSHEQTQATLQSQQFI